MHELDEGIIRRGNYASFWAVILIAAGALSCGAVRVAAVFAGFGVLSLLNFICLQNLLVAALKRQGRLKTCQWGLAAVLMLVSIVAGFYRLERIGLAELLAFIGALHVPWLVLSLKVLGHALTRESRARRESQRRAGSFEGISENSLLQ